jgi:DNA-binding MarR family transcriptional regulator
MKAAVEGAREVGLAVTASTFTTLLALKDMNAMDKEKNTTPVQGSHQVDECMIGILVFNREVDEFRQFYLEALFSEDLSGYKEHLERICHSGRSSRRIDNLDIFSTICLVLSGERGPLTMGEIGQAINVPLSTATRIIDWMTESGYVIRFNDPGDRRVVRVGLTGTGREVFQALYAFMCRKASHILEQFTDSEKTVLISLINKFSGILSLEKDKATALRASKQG